MRKIFVVAAREYRAAVQTKAFLIGLLMMPIMFGGSIFVQVLLRGRVDVTDKRIAVVDYSGQLLQTIQTAAQVRNETQIQEGTGAERKQVAPKYVIDSIPAGASDEAHTTLELSNKVRKKELMAFVVIGRDVLQPGGKGTAATSTINYYSNSPTYDDVRQWLAAVLNERIPQLRVQSANLDPGILRELTRRVGVGNLGLVEMDTSGQIIEAKEANAGASFLVPFAMMFLMFMVVMASAAPLMNSVLEEKMQRIAEVLLGSIAPFKLMLGKLLGMVGVSLTMAAVYLSGAYAALSYAGYTQYFPWHIVGWFIAFLALAVWMYGSIFIAIGAAVTDMKEAQSMMTPVMLIIILPMFVLQNVMREPNSSQSMFMSLVPIATPMLMIVRQAVPPGVPLWQPVVGITLVIVTSFLFVFGAGRVFRVGILMQGKGGKLSDIIRWAIRG